MAYSKAQIKTFKEEILDLLAEGKSLKYILDENNHLPARQTVYNWLNENHNNFDKEFLDNYVRARQDSADLNAETIEDIAYKTLNGEYKSDQARVAIDALKWAAGKKNPKKYGDRIEVDNKHEIKETPSFNFKNLNEQK